MLDIIDLIKLGGYPLSVAAFFYGLHVGKVKANNKLLINKLEQKENEELNKEALNSVPLADKRNMFNDDASKLPSDSEW